MMHAAFSLLQPTGCVLSDLVRWIEIDPLALEMNPLIRQSEQDVADTWPHPLLLRYV